MSVLTHPIQAASVLAEPPRQPIVMTEHCDGLFHLDCAPEDSSVAREAGFVFDGKLRKWLSSDPVVIQRGLPYATDEAKAGFSSYLAQRNHRLHASFKTDSTFAPPLASGFEARPYQRAGVELLLDQVAESVRTPAVRGALLADDMGLGKTIQAIGLIGAKRGMRSVLIVVPASLRLNWLDEITEKAVLHDRSVAVLSTPKAKKLAKRKKETDAEFAVRKESAKQPDVLPNANIIIVGYEAASSRFNALLKDRPWDLVIYDEAHFVKNEESRRTRNLLGTPYKNKEDRGTPGLRTRFSLFLTGTPILNRPQELWTILRTIDPFGLGSNYFRFATRYCGMVKTEFGHDFIAPDRTALRELNAQLRGGGMIRRLKKDVLTDLPPKQRQVIRIEAEPGDLEMIETQNAERDERRLKMQALETSLAQARFLKDDKGTIAAQLAIERLDNEGRGALAKALHATALRKIEAAHELINSILETGEKIVVFAHHKDVLLELAKPYQACSVMLTGDTDDATVQVNKKKFQTDDATRLIFANIMKGNAGHTLTAARIVLFVELDWRDAITRQCEDRVHRIGQSRMVQSLWLALADSIDETVIRANFRKKDLAAAALDDLGILLEHSPVPNDRASRPAVNGATPPAGPQPATVPSPKSTPPSASRDIQILPSRTWKTAKPAQIATAQAPAPRVQPQPAPPITHQSGHQSQRAPQSGGTAPVVGAGYPATRSAPPSSPAVSGATPGPQPGRNAGTPTVEPPAVNIPAIRPPAVNIPANSPATNGVPPGRRSPPPPVTVASLAPANTGLPAWMAGVARAPSPAQPPNAEPVAAKEPDGTAIAPEKDLPKSAGLFEFAVNNGGTPWPVAARKRRP